jgi:hypothetical protein
VAGDETGIAGATEQYDALHAGLLQTIQNVTADETIAAGETYFHNFFS